MAPATCCSCLQNQQNADLLVRRIISPSVTSEYALGISVWVHLVYGSQVLDTCLHILQLFHGPSWVWPQRQATA